MFYCWRLNSKARDTTAFCWSPHTDYILRCFNSPEKQQFYIISAQQRLEKHLSICYEVQKSNSLFYFSESTCINSPDSLPKLTQSGYCTMTTSSSSLCIMHRVCAAGVMHQITRTHSIARMNSNIWSRNLGGRIINRHPCKSQTHL